MNSTTGRISDLAGSGAEAARDTFASTRESLGEAGDAARKAAKATVKDATAYGRQNAGKAYDVAGDAARSISSYIQEKPLQAGLIALGGLLVAGMIFRGRR
jgi:ElaB/YqjD/DUF883 family membrane-anchored ribosome-binding protein